MINVSMFYSEVCFYSSEEETSLFDVLCGKC